MSMRFRISEMAALTAITREQAPGKPMTKTAGRTGRQTQKCQGKLIGEVLGYRRSWRTGTLMGFAEVVTTFS
jgi:hypothetical protein